MILLASVLIFIFGTIIGSFLSVVLYRTKHKKKGIMLSRSMCPGCKKKLKWNYLIPIFSWLFLKGKCGYCGKKISSHYLMLELITGILFMSAFLYWPFIAAKTGYLVIDWQILQEFIYYLIITIFLELIFFYDLFHKIIPDRFSLPAVVIAIAGGLTLGLVSPLSMLIGGISLGLFFALQFIISKGAWVGGGDIRLGLLAGVLLGWQLGILSLVIAYVLGASFSIVLLAQKKASRKTEIAFGPFIVAGIFITIFWGTEILNWYLNTLTI